METTEKLEHGMYCEVTEEQAKELLIIEGDFNDDPSYYMLTFFSGDYPVVTIRYWDNELLLSGRKNAEQKTQLPFPDFKDRLVNTVKG